MTVADLPDRVVALWVGEDGPVELSAAAYSLVIEPFPELVPRYLLPATAWVWCNGEDWTLQRAGLAPEPLRPGGAWEIGGVRVRADWLSLGSAGVESTLSARATRISLIVRYTSVHVLRDRREPFVVDGLPARVLSELALMRSTAEWSAVAKEIWPMEEDSVRLRQCWDRALRRLRSRLREGGLREDLVRSDGSGNVELFLAPGDRVVDEA